MPRCVTCAIVSVVAWVSLKRGGSGLRGMRSLALRKRGGYDQTTFGFKKPMQFGRRVEVPPQNVEEQFQVLFLYPFNIAPLHPANFHNHRDGSRT